MTDLDIRLRAVARDALDRAAADTPLDADLAVLRARVATRPSSPPGSERTWPWQRLAVAAALVLLVGSAVVLLASRGADEELVAPVTEPTIAETSTDATTMPADVAASLAIADPAVVAPGWTVSITPAGEVRRTCLDIVSVAANTAEGLVHRGLVLSDGWDTSTPPTVPACEGRLTVEPITVTVPAALEHGEYRFCVAGDDEPAGCALVQVASVTTTTPITTSTVAPPVTATLPVGYVERVYVDDPPYFVLREHAPDGSIVGEAGDDAVAELLRREVSVGEGTVRLLQQEEPYGRCDNRQVATSGPSPAATPDGDLIGPARSLAATADGVVIVGVDVCPDGGRWGDDGTRFELRRVDLRDGSTSVLFERLPGEGDTFFEDANVVYAGGELIAESVSPDGAFVAVAEPYTTEDTRYHVIDAVAGGDPIELGSSCDDPGDLVGPSRFVGDGLVVVARECSAVGGEIGDLVVELVSLATRQPVWSVEVQHVAIDSYSHTVSLSATSVDGQVWALVSASPGIEQPVTAAALTEGVEQPLPVAANVAFTPAELIWSWDPYSA